MKNKKTDHSVYNLNYHIVLVVKYRHTVLHGEIEEYVKKRITEICQEYKWDLIALEVMPDHIHIFVSAPPKIAPLVIASTIKSILTVDTFKNIWGLKAYKFWGAGLFSRGTYYGSAGTVSAETIKKYIAEQKNEKE